MRLKFRSVLVLFSGCFLFWGTAACFAQTTLFSQNELSVHGLTRAWYNQVPVGQASDGIAHVLLDRGTLFVVSKQAGVYAYDAETGKLLWNRFLSENKWDTLPPSANSKTFGVVNGTDVMVLDRRNGRLLWQVTLPDNAGAGCVMSEYFIYVPLISGLVFCYPQMEFVATDEILENLVEAFQNAGYKFNPVTGKIVSTEEIQPLANKELAELSQSIGTEAFEKLREAYLKVGYQPNVVSGKFFVPETLAAESGEVEPYYMRQADRLPLSCISFGNTLVQPILTNVDREEENLAWITDKGQLFVAKSRLSRGEGTFALQYRVNVNPETLFRSPTKLHQLKGNVANDISFRPTHAQRNPDAVNSQSLVIVGTNSGYVVAYNEASGEIVWVYSTGIPVASRIAVIGKNVYAVTKDGTLTCLNVDTGIPVWKAAQLGEFVAASPNRLYFTNSKSELVGVSPVDGTQSQLFSLDRRITTYFNLQNDRIYLISNSGLVQMVRETSLEKPVEHLIPIEKFMKEGEKQSTVSKSTGKHAMAPRQHQQQDAASESENSENIGGGEFDGFNDPFERPQPPASPPSTPSSASPPISSTPQDSDDPF
ncbi:MAG: PQQ-binding-like beta-propeller repeat protein [Planctomycetaceae bacterium]|jgi:outer membrane protein assembly factor BamB|nr:PQQ-binding-like beta-propeller repeat protein [Planctomycetaceae bacterium]